MQLAEWSTEPRRRRKQPHAIPFRLTREMRSAVKAAIRSLETMRLETNRPALRTLALIKHP